MRYTMIRGQKQEDRCTNDNKGRLYCDCGCQAPHADDPPVNLDGVVVSGRAKYGYADYTITRNGKVVGEYNTQYGALFLDGYEYLGCDRNDLRQIRDQIFDGEVNLFPRQREQTGAGDTLEETAAAVNLAENLAEIEQDERNKNNPGYCNKCHSYCFGDCEAN